MQQVDRTKTLEELEGESWGEPSFNSRLVIRVHELRKQPLNEFSHEDLRLLILQQISLEFLLPLAFERLIMNPLASGDLYIGDLFCSVLQVDQEYWEDHIELKNELNEVIRIYNEARKTVEDQISKYRNNDM
ncbi:contact-dependent growth inhibition system immunity protein [Paenibacillus sp. DCT19]|uniref:contact-dependent growth inhibition system immunity protein n=1 Tax=Paenibacillus sp. DCT19 TaxID=2211212 RepID=UPI0013E3A926|nr:contact-dependent growth inhibition system immunity protein [Paenibacillus sp. DCT19]